MLKTLTSAWRSAALGIALFAVFAVASGLDHPVRAESGHQSILRIGALSQYPATRHIVIGLNKSTVVELPRDVRDVLVSNPKILEAVVHTTTRAYLIGMEVGQANAHFFGKDGKQILTLEVKVERDLTDVRNIMQRLMPGSNVQLEAVNDNIVLTGTVANAADASRASDIASRLVDEKEKVLNMLAVESKEQVHLKVTVAEMNRTVIKQLGIDITQANTGFAAIATSGNFTLEKLTDLAFPFNDKDVIARSLGSVLFNDGTLNIRGTIRALEQANLLRTLAEPNLTAISGETASFLAGGEFPIPISQDEDTISVEFKPFGVGLSFTPVVMSEGRISMKVSTEVSELSSDNSINIGTLSIPGLNVRRANTVIELPSGGSLVMAGLLREESKEAMTGVPGVKNLPIIGTLFRSRDFIKNETELVVIVTPVIVNPVARRQLAKPDDNFAQAPEFKAAINGRLNRIYRRDPEPPVATYKGAYGFIVD